MKRALQVIAGAVVGGLGGYFAFFWLVRQGYYGLVLPGGLLGLGAAIARNRSLPLAVGCGLAALALGFFTEWRWAPFRVDGSLLYFLGHLPQLEPITLIMVALGGFLGFWIPFRRTPGRPQANDQITP